MSIVEPSDVTSHEVLHQSRKVRDTQKQQEMDVIRHPAVVDELGTIAVEGAYERPFETEPILIVEEEDFVARRVLSDVVRKTRAERIEVTPHTSLTVPCG